MDKYNMYMILNNPSVHPASGEPRERGGIADRIAQWVLEVEPSRIPDPVLRKAKQLILDCTGISFASSREAFAAAALRGLRKAGGGSTPVIAMEADLPLRDAVLLNGLLVHGLDFDDTHMEGIIHASASCLPCALGVAAEVGASGRDMLVAYVTGLEIATRLSIVAKGKLHARGFHPTGLIGAFACTLIAGKLLGLSRRQLTMAQGIALSLASAGSQEFLQEGAWTKRLHPGSGAAAGITAALLASEDFVGPTGTYEGRYGLYRIYLQEDLGDQLEAALADLGRVWRTAEIAVKPFPICHYNHGVMDAAIAAAGEPGLRVDEIDMIEAFLPEAAHHIVCEPIELKRRPLNDYDARFSAPYAVAVGLARRQFGLAELKAETRSDPEVLALAAKVVCLPQPNAAFPKYFSGEVALKLKDGRRIVRSEMMNRGCPDRPLSDEDVWSKFVANASLALNGEVVEVLGARILSVEKDDAASFARFLSRPVATISAARSQLQRQA